MNAHLQSVPADPAEVSPPERDDRADERLRARAELAHAYVSMLGIDALRSDLETALRSKIDSDGQVSPSDMSNALTELGLKAEAVVQPEIAAAHCPALAQMSNGQWILVLSVEDDGVIIHDQSCADNRTEVSFSEFNPFFSGHLVRANHVISNVADQHGLAALSKHWFWGEFPKFARPFGEIAVGSLVANLLAVAVALFSLQVYDRVIPHQSQATLWILAIGAGLALLLEGALKIARSKLVDGAGRQIELNVQTLLMNRILGMRSDAEGRSPSQLFSSMRDFSSVREFFTATSVGAMADIPFIFLFLAIVASIAGNVVWVLIAGGILMVAPALFARSKMMQLTQEMQGATVHSSRLLYEAISELDLIKGQRGEDRFRRIWGELTALQALKSSQQRQLAARLTYWSQGVQQGTYVATVIAGTYLVFQGDFTVGSIIAIGILTGRTLAPLTQLSGTLVRWGNVKTALDALDRVADAPQDTEEGRSYLRRGEIDGEFSLIDLSYRYEQDGPPVIDMTGISIPAGQHVALLGTNGSGKSTLLKLLSGMYQPNSGRILLDGTDIGQIAPRDIRGMIGYMEQEVRLFSGTLRENLDPSLLERDTDRLFEALDFAGLGHFVKSHPKGLDLPIHDRGAGLSTGQRQSIGWARLWLQDPKVCLLDEPTAALDQTLEKTLISRLEKWLEGRTAVIATHRMPILSLTSRTLVMQNGRMMVDGPRDKVLEHLTSAKETRR